MDPVLEIKSRLSIEELVWEYVTLKKAWKSYKWLCPWHQEKTPSFIVNPENDMCWCFWCQKWWDIFNFLEYTENLDFKESLQILSNRVWVKVETSSFTSKEEKDSKVHILSEISKFYSMSLLGNKNALEYLSERWIQNDMISLFNIWYSPKNVNLLYSHLLKLWFDKQSILDCWVLSSNDFSWSDIYDRFNWRIVFPICSWIWVKWSNSVIWFWARIFSWEQGLAKYINSPDTSIYDKSSTLYRIDLAKDEIKRKNFTLVVEWYMDVIACFKAWIKNTIASSGTAFTENQVKILKRYSSNIYFCFDSDAAWLDAAKRAIKLCANLDVNISFVKVSNWKDPDECLSNDKQRFINALNSPLTIVDFIFSNISKDRLIDIDWKKSVEIEIFELINQITNNLEKQEYLKILSKLLKIEEKSLISDFGNYQKNKKQINKKIEAQSVTKRFIDQEQYLIWIYLSFETYSDIIKDHLIASISSSNILKKVYKYISNKYNSAALMESLSLDERKEVLSYAFYAQNINEKSSESKIIKEINTLVRNINLKNILKKEELLLNKIREARDNEQDILTNKYQEIIKLKSKLLAIH